MHKKIDFTKTGGLWLTQNTLDFMQDGASGAFDAIAKLVGDKAVLDGVVITGTNVSNGWVSYNEQILPFVGGLKTNYIDLDTIVTNEQFDDGTLKPTYTTLRLKMVAIASGTSFPFNDLIYPGTFKNVWVKGDIKEVECDMAYYLANFDGTGLGLNERAGWAVCGTNGTRERAGMVSVMINPADADMNDFGKTGGVKDVQLTAGQLPKTELTIKTVGYGGIGGSGTKLVGNAGNPDGADLKLRFGNDEAHTNMQPFTVSLFICKL